MVATQIESGALSRFMRFLNNLFNRKDKTRISEAREQRARAIEEMGLSLVDESGWKDGRYYQKRYVLTRDGEVVAGPFASSSEALRAAKQLRNS